MRVDLNISLCSCLRDWVLLIADFDDSAHAGQVRFGRSVPLCSWLGVFGGQYLRFGLPLRLFKFLFVVF